MPGTLNHSSADVVQQVLVALGLGVAPPAVPWPVFVDSDPDAPDSMISVWDTTGIKHGRVQVTGETQEHHGVMIRVRSDTHANGYAKARAIAVGIDEDVYQETVHLGASTYLLHAITRVGDVNVLGKEVPTARRSLFTINALVFVQQL